MQTVTVVSNDDRAACLPRTTSDLCRCRSCGCDVRRNIHSALLGFYSRRMRGVVSGLVKARVATVCPVCSELCKRRLLRDDGGGEASGRRGKAWGWTFDRLDSWFGSLAFLEFSHFIAGYHFEDGIDLELSLLLHAITLPVFATVIKIRSEMKDVIAEAKEAIAQ
jgi:hypothetical protein